MAGSPAQGVVDRRNRVFGYKNMYVCAGSVIAANRGVNPSLAICTLTERAMSYIPTAAQTAWNETAYLGPGEMPMSEPKTQEVKSGRRSSRRAALAIVAIAFAAAAIFVSIRVYRIWSANERLQPDLINTDLINPPPQRPAPEPPGHPVILRTIHLRPSEQRHLLDGNFTLVRRMSDITEPCKDIFESSFLAFSGSPAPKQFVRFADPGQDFHSTDVILGDLPFRRLVFAGLGTKTCFVHYEMGGQLFPPTGCLAIVDYRQKKTVWVGERRKPLRSFKALRTILAGGHFENFYGGVC